MLLSIRKSYELLANYAEGRLLRSGNLRQMRNRARRGSFHTLRRIRGLFLELSAVVCTLSAMRTSL